MIVGPTRSGYENLMPSELLLLASYWPSEVVIMLYDNALSLVCTPYLQTRRAGCDVNYGDRAQEFFLSDPD